MQKVVEAVSQERIKQGGTRIRIERQLRWNLVLSISCSSIPRVDRFLDLSTFTREDRSAHGREITRSKTLCRLRYER